MKEKKELYKRETWVSETLYTCPLKGHLDKLHEQLIFNLVRAMPAQFMRKKYVAKEKWKVKQQRQDGTKYRSPNKAKADECQL